MMYMLAFLVLAGFGLLAWLAFRPEKDETRASKKTGQEKKSNNRESEKQEKNLISVSYRLFYTLTAVWSVAIVIALIYGTYSIVKEQEMVLGATCIVMAVVWFVRSLRRVDTEEYLGVAFFGTPVWVTGPGLKVIPFKLFETTFVPAGVVQEQFPADPERVFKGHDDEQLPNVTITRPDGSQEEVPMVRPIRVTTGGPTSVAKKGGTEEKQNEAEILDSRMALEITFFVRWRVESGDLFNFILNSQGSLGEINRQMRDAGEQLLAAEFAARTPMEIIADFASIRESLENAIKRNIEGWGINILQVGWTSPDLGRTVSEALRDVPSAKARRVVAELQAQAAAFATVQNLVAEGEGLQRQAELLKIDAADALAAKVAEKTVGEADLILGTPGLAQVMGLLQAVSRGRAGKGDVK